MAISYPSIWIAVGTRNPDTRAFTATSLAANVTSDANPCIGKATMASATFMIESGTPTGTFYIDVTDDPRAADRNGAYGTPQWANVQSVTFTSGLSNSASCAHVTWENGAAYARVRWVSSSGTGTGFAFVTGVSV